ncbi:winged helix-turn-helix domain-containing protein [Mitsuaria sp. BK037]|uniref:ATP-binding protein n=1 Tax=Mitsuaria sp. BK037 TaxID=2587122 RepID=UPI001619386D|nr:winged helix-turn-helix domain-containing protein [Mitsuaria sp. BK037]MBB3281256.1 putative ATPase/DNA-binding winged helix-turn-helix (wHTH) protein [Mitsuaria sp. BK037]
MRAASLRFADRFELQPLERRLLVDGQPATLGSRALDVLIALIQRAGELVGKSELIDLAWPGVVVEENNLQVQVSALRKVLGGDVITTIPGRGYRFTARVEDATHAAPPRTSLPSSPLSSPRSPPPPATLALRTNLPAGLPRLLGRDEDLAALLSLIEHHRLVTLVGAGGMGKTRLAQALLHSRTKAYPHGVCWVELAPVTDAAALPGAIAAALGIRLGAGEEPLDGLAAALASLTLLLALDNAEHLLDATARIAGVLHAAAPGLRIVVTSQAPLKLPPERVYRLEALSTPQGAVSAAQALNFGAVALFVERAQAADARFALTDANAPAVIELCRALDGLALAIELAAARAPMLGVQRLAASLDERLRLLTSSRNRDAPARQQTLRAALEWSHGFLDERERIVFRRLAVIAGSASLELIQQVAGDAPGGRPVQGPLDAQDPVELDEWAVLDAVTVLVERSLLVCVVGDDAESPPRYRLLDSPRAFARELLARSDEDDLVRDRHARAVATLCEALHHARLSGEIGVDAWGERARADLDNAREALLRAQALGDTDAALAIIAMLLFALPRTLHAERNALCDRFDALAGGAQGPMWLQASLGVAMQYLNSVHNPRAQAHMRRMVEVARARIDAPDGRFHLYRALAMSLAMPPAGREDEDAELCALEDPDWPPQRLHYGLIGLMLNRSDPREQLRLGHRIVANCRAGGDANPIYLANLADAQLLAGDPEGAIRTGIALLAQLQPGRDEYGLAYARLNTAAAYLALGDTRSFRPLAEQGWPLAAKADLQRYWCQYLSLLAALEGRPRAAARLAGHVESGTAGLLRFGENEALAGARAQRLAREALGAAEFERLKQDGMLLRNADIGALAFALTDVD